MKVLAFADIPSRFVLPDEQPDIVLLLGDIFYRNVLRIDHKYSCPKVGILGNHDKSHYFDDTDIINAHRTIVEVEGLRIAGFEGCPRYNSKPFGQHSEMEAKQFVSAIRNEQLDMFLAHSNPVYNETEQDAHRGFSSFNDLFENKLVNHFFHGHLHDPFELLENQTQVYSVYPYKVVQI